MIDGAFGESLTCTCSTRDLIVGFLVGFSYLANWHCVYGVDSIDCESGSSDGRLRCVWMYFVMI